MLDKLPSDMIVPTMYLVNVTKPLVAHETFEWLRQMKFIKQQQVTDPNKSTMHAQQQHQRNMLYNDGAKRTGPIGYDSEIMSGISDNFAFTKIDSALPHSYFGVGQEDKNAIFTAPQEQTKITKNDQTKLMKELESKRMSQDTDHKNVAKQQQLEAVMLAEQAKPMQMYH